MIKVIVSSKEANQRIDKFVKKYLNEAPLSFVYKLFRKKDVKVNGHWVKQDYFINEGEEITLYVGEDQLKEFSKPKETIKKDFPHEIIYEDENIILINKPRGLLVHGDINEKRVTLTNDVLNYLYFKGEYDPNNDKGFTPAPAHRLDRNTSGIIAYAKTLNALNCLEKLFKDKTELTKTYLALVVGNFPNYMEIDLPLLKDPNSGLVKVTKEKDGGQRALSKVSINKHFKGYSLVNVELVTGRTHQIRVHLASKNYPVVGDAKYGNFKINKDFKSLYGFENQFLHAYSLEFKDIPEPLNYLKNKKFTANLPANEKKILSELD